METSVKAAEVLVPPQPEVASSSPDADHTEGAACSASCSSDDDSFIDPMVEFSRRLEDIVSAHGSAASALDKQLVEEAKEEIAAATEKEVSQLRQNLNKLPSPEQKLEDLLRRYAELAVLRRCDEKKLCVLQAESRSSVAARSKLETLCRELQGHYKLLREETFKRCKEDEEKRKEMTNHFQMMLTEIQAQIEQHSTRNDKLCQENTNLTSKLESLMNQCELREQSLENINKRRDLQQKLTEAKLQQADALLAEAEEKHKREKEYLLREAIDKTKKCFAMKEQELAMKKKLTLYAQKFDEFQGTLAKSNEIYARFKKEMENMSDKMKKMEKESNVWKTRFENCNKALTDMIEERTEKGKEYDMFVLKIQKLEKLCRALQDERAILYDKIKEVRSSNASIPLRVFGISKDEDTPNAEGEDTSALLTPVEVEKIQEEDPVLTEDMTRLREEQTKLQEFAASLLAAPSDDEEEHNDEIEPEEDVVASAFFQFKTKTQAKEKVVPIPEQAVEEKTVLPQPEKVEEVPTPVVSAPEAPTPADTKPEAVKVENQVEDKDVPPVKPVEEIQQQPAEPVTTSEPEKVEINPPTDLKPEAAEAQISVEAAEVKPVISVEEEKVQAEPVKVPEEAPTESDSSPPSKNTPKATADSSKKQTPKKKKKRNNKNVS